MAIWLSHTIASTDKINREIKALSNNASIVVGLHIEVTVTRQLSTSIQRKELFTLATQNAIFKSLDKSCF